MGIEIKYGCDRIDDCTGDCYLREDNKFFEYHGTKNQDKHGNQ